MTAANSTALTDGASAVLLASEDWAKARKLPVRAYLTHTEVGAVDFVDKKEGLLMAPAYAVPRLLDKAGLTLQDFDFYEIHEAFASQVLCTLKAWEDPTFCKEKLGLSKPLGSIDRKKLNVKGKQPRGRSSFCGHGRPHSGHGCQDPGGEGQRSCTGFHLCCRWPGRYRYCGALNPLRPCSSRSWAKRMVVRSCPGAPMIWIAKGIPSASRPTGADVAGNPSSVARAIQFI